MAVARQRHFGVAGRRRDNDSARLQGLDVLLLALRLCSMVEKHDPYTVCAIVGSSLHVRACAHVDIDRCTFARVGRVGLSMLLLCVLVIPSTSPCTHLHRHAIVRPKRIAVTCVLLVLSVTDSLERFAVYVCIHVNDCRNVCM